MVEIREDIDAIAGKTSLEIDKRTIPKISNPPNVKHLRYSRVLPVQCNACPYRPEIHGGNDICKKFVENGACIIRKDIAKMVDKHNERDSEKLLGMLESSYENNFEKLMFFESMEDQSGALDPEVTKRMNVMNNTFKIINEARTNTSSIEVSKTKTLTEGQKEQIIETLKLTESVKTES